MTLSPGTFRRIAAALMVTSSLTFAGVAVADDPTKEESLAAFDASDYTYCDAKLIAAGIAESVEGGKIRIGGKILTGTADQLPGRLAGARQYASCTWADTQHSYDDAEVLAGVWGLADANVAKDKVAKLYTQGRSAEVLAALQQAGGGALTAEQEQAVTAFHQSDYTYCDAKLVSAAWDINIDQAKAEIGVKILNGYAENLQQIFAAGRQETQCSFADTQLSYEDAEKLAAAWGIPVEQAKDVAAQHYTNGQSAMVLAALTSAPTIKPTTPITEEPPPSERSQ